MMCSDSKLKKFYLYPSVWTFVSPSTLSPPWSSWPSKSPSSLPQMGAFAMNVKLQPVTVCEDEILRPVFESFQ